MLINIWNRNSFPASRVRRIVSVSLAVAYPVLAHSASILKSPGLTLASVATLAAAILFKPLTEGRRGAWLALPVVATALVGLWRIDAASLVLFLPPVLLNAFLAWLFGHTLVRGSTPLIERLVRLLQPPDGGPPEPGVIRYAGNLTRVWTALFVLLATVNLGLAAFATPGGLLETIGVRAPLSISRTTWSLFANILNYAIVAAFFLLEYAYRRRRFPNRPYRNLPEFLRRAVAIAPALTATIGSRMTPGARGADMPTGGATLEITFKVPMDHPAFAGHFPGRPILPAVVLLERVIEAAEKACDGPLAIMEMPRAKFLSPLAPGDCASIHVRREREHVHFEVRRGEIRVAQGLFRIGGGGRPG
jgi:uncharacterized membrane protein/3-hydroxymyristoyl/3-hydroxydecanoyl-(acyl carrier protein) dehydratase